MPLTATTAEDRPSAGHLVVWIIVAVLAAYVLFIGGGSVSTLNVDIRRLSLLLTTLGIGVWIIPAIRDPIWRPRSVLAPALAWRWR